MDRAEEISRWLVRNRREGRVDQAGVLGAVKSVHRFLPNFSLSFYAYIRKRVEIFADSPGYAVVTGQTVQMQMYCGMVMYASNGYFLLCVQPDCTAEVVKLDFSELADYTVYSGQIIKILGVNPIGEEVVVDSVVYDKVLDLVMKPEKETQFTVAVINAKKAMNEEILQNSGIKVHKENALDSGKKQLDSEAVLELVRKSTSDVVIVFGDIPVEEREMYKEMCSTKKIRIVCVPAHDGIESTMAYPTEYLNRASHTAVPSVTDAQAVREIYEISGSLFVEVQNPSMISMNGVLIALSSIDVLLGISRKEISRNRKTRMLDIITHSVYQSTFLPFVPSDVPVDYSVSSAFIWPYSPDLYIFPTLLSANMEEVCGTYAVPLNRTEIELSVHCTVDGTVSVETVRSK
ncbi:DNA polymerase alpha subunit B [Nematocida minor]|uniref:DNA polymerase alpha subunit B n=1 Tax=Nematocida minor TaxID=1912983 RepID=UPI0022211CA5|nr:DNA polymerase alpha subunit B [Nematocida minor]KAI5192717.1 DNA polymerase alpha subunit B [Nematocida minor]